jgi:hypothetical protein
MGFDGARKHQKVEDPRWLFWADTLGFLVWGEMANAYQYGPGYVRRMTAEWQDAVMRNYNHPSIITWVHEPGFIREASSLGVVNDQLGLTTPNGTFWHRFNFDGYGEQIRELYG